MATNTGDFFQNYLLGMPATMTTTATSNNLQQLQVPSVILADSNDMSKTRIVAKELAELLGMSPKFENKEFFSDLRMVIEAAMEVLTRPEVKKEPPATEKPKFDNRPAGSRWR